MIIQTKAKKGEKSCGYCLRFLCPYRVKFFIYQNDQAFFITHLESVYDWTTCIKCFCYIVQG